MKPLYILLILGLSTSICEVALAQTNVYHPFPESNAEWFVSTQVSGDCWGVCYNKYVLTELDTLISGFSYSRVNGVNLYNDGPNPCCDFGGSTYFIREDTTSRTVNYINESGIDTVLYDFTMEIGDTVPGHIGMSGGLWPIIITSIDSILINNSYRKQWNALISGESRSIIEGIGNSNGLFEPISLPSEVTTILTCVSVNDGIVYGFEECNIVAIPEMQSGTNMILIHPNPSVGVFQVESNKMKNPISLTLYDVYGHFIGSYSTNPRTGIDLSSQLNGLYFLAIKYPNGQVLVEKLILQK